MKKEEQLSDFKQVMRISGKAVVVYPEENVKEFIKRLKEDFGEVYDESGIIITISSKELDKLAGEEFGGNGK